MISRDRNVETQDEYCATATVWHSGEGGGITVLEHIARTERNRENRMFDRLWASETVPGTFLDHFKPYGPVGTLQAAHRLPRRHSAAAL